MRRPALVATMLFLVMFMVVLNGLLVALLVPMDTGLPWIAAEGLVLAGVVLAAPARGLKVGLAWAAGGLYGASALFVVADALVRASLGRPLNLYHDVSLAGSATDLLLTNLGLPLSLGVAGLALLLWLLLAALVARLLLRIAALGQGMAWRYLGLGLLVLAAVGLALPLRFVGTTATMVASAQAGRVQEARHAALAFRRQVSDFAGPGMDRGVSLDRLGETSVVLAFVESYGVTALFDDRYRPVVAPAVEQLATAVQQRGWHLVSGRLRSPVQGGQSWLAHSTVLSGLWVDSQQDYDALIASNVPTLINDFGLTGHRSVAVMPAITMAWPEGHSLGYDEIFDAGTMAYQGPAFNWVTMPDQYTWSWFHDTVLTPSRQPVFAELALISSHAPWVPVIPVLEDWDQIRQGRVFLQWRGAGEAPASLWQDPDRVRAQYARAMAYSIEVIAGYISQRMSGDTLLIIMGDHQPAPLVTGNNASRDVPVHLVSADPALLEPFVGTNGEDGLTGFRRGAWPSADVAGPGMDRFRPFLHRQF